MRDYRDIIGAHAPLPNIRKMFVPDPGYIIVDADLKQADAQVVAAEADDQALLAVFRDPNADVHMSNARDIFGPDVGPVQRQQAKQGVHLTNYLGNARMLAAALHISVAQAERFQRIWFLAHPGIHEWHERIEQQLFSTRRVQNRFGYHRYYFDRIQGVLKEALAWIPQSTVALVINRAWHNINVNLPQIHVLLQNHDSLMMQVPRNEWPALAPEIKRNMLIPIPYDPPLQIAVDCKVSTRSWGECEKFRW